MNSKQRVHAALSGKKTDRVPVWMWYHPETAEKLSRFLDIPQDKVSEAMGDDIRQTWVGNNYAMEGIKHDSEGETHTDCWGIRWIKEGPFNQILNSPLHEASQDEILNYEYPFGKIPELLKNMWPVMASSNEYFVGCDVSPCLFEMICRIRGMENALMDFAGDTNVMKTMLEKAGSFSVELSEAACQAFKLDWLWTGDDVGGHHGMMLSPDSWREMVKPELARIFKVARKRNLRVAYHSCGAIRPIIPDLVEIGLDVLNPIQTNCPGMDAFELKKEFGRQLSFMGGVDTHRLLPLGTEEEVYSGTAQLVEKMSESGGFILAASHTVPPETPIENILAMYRAAGISRKEIFDRAADIRAKK